MPRPHDRGPPRQHQERRLKRVLGEMRVADHAPADAQHHRPMPANQGGESVAVARSDKRCQQLPVAHVSAASDGNATQVRQQAMSCRVDRHEGLPVGAASRAAPSSSKVRLGSADLLPAYVTIGTPLSSKANDGRDFPRADGAPPVDDANELLRRCQSGNESALATLVERFGGRVFRLAFRVLGDGGRAEEASADAFVKLWSTARHWRGEADAGTWIYRVAYHAIVDFSRRKQRKWATPPADLFDPRPGPLELIDRAETQEQAKRRLNEAMGQLFESDRASFTCTISMSWRWRRSRSSSTPRSHRENCRSTIKIYPIEVVACWANPKGKKAHETVLTIDVKPSDVHKALESIGLKPGKPARGEDAELRRPRGQGSAGNPRRRRHAQAARFTVS